jgi:hypothetical protein
VVVKAGGLSLEPVDADNAVGGHGRALNGESVDHLNKARAKDSRLTSNPSSSSSLVRERGRGRTIVTRALRLLGGADCQAGGEGQRRCRCLQDAERPNTERGSRTKKPVRQSRQSCRTGISKADRPSPQTFGPVNLAAPNATTGDQARW